MKLIDNQGRIGGKLSVIDLGIILILIAVAIGAIWKFNVSPVTGTHIETPPVRYTIEVVGVRDWAMHNIRVGDTIFHQGSDIGTVVNVESQAHRLLVQGATEAWWGYVPDRYVVLVEVEATASRIDGRVLINRTTPLGVGNSEQPFTTRYAEFHGTIKEIIGNE